MQLRVSNTIPGALRSLVHHGSITQKEMDQYIKELSTVHMKRIAWDELIARFGLMEEAPQRFTFHFPVKVKAA